MLTVLRNSLRNASTMRVNSSRHSKTSGRNYQMNLSSSIYGICVGFVRKMGVCESCFWKIKKIGPAMPF